MHDDVIKWKYFPCYWPFVRGIHRSPVNSPHKGQWRGALMFSLICTWMNDWVNNREAGDLRRHHAHYDVTVIDINVFRRRQLLSLDAIHSFVAKFTVPKLVFPLNISRPKQNDCRFCGLNSAMYFLDRKTFYIYSNLTEICSLVVQLPNASSGFNVLTTCLFVRAGKRDSRCERDKESP